MNRVLRLSLVAAACCLAGGVHAQFVPGGSDITGTVGAQTLSSGTGTVHAGAAISVSASSAALALSGSSTLHNLGSILNNGSGRAIDSNAGLANLTVFNTGLIGSVSGDAFRVNTNSAVALTNSGIIRVSNGGQAIDWASITSAANVLTNLAGASITTVGEDAVRPGTGGVIVNAGTISATPSGASSPSGSDGIDVRTFTGISVTNSGFISGRHGIATDGSNNNSFISVANHGGGVIQAVNGSGINIDGVFATVRAEVLNQSGATIRGGVLGTATTGDGDGIDVDGVLTLHNAGQVLGLGAKGAGNNAEGIAAGGGSIINVAGGRIVGSTLAADAPGGDTARAGNGILIDDGNGGRAVAATTVTNAGLIQGVSGFAIKLVGDFSNWVSNLAGGVIQGAGDVAVSGAALQTGNGHDTVVQGGTVIGVNGLAIDLQGGNNTLVIAGGAAHIEGDVSGGTGGRNLLRLALGEGQHFVYAGALSNFHDVVLESGQVQLDGHQQLDDAALALAGGDLRLTAAGELHLRSLSLLDDALVDLAGAAALVFDELGDVVAGATLAMTGVDPLQGHALRFVGDLTENSGFLALVGQTTVAGGAAAFGYDGRYTWLGLAAQTVDAPAPLALLACGVLALVGTRQRRVRASARAGLRQQA